MAKVSFRMPRRLLPGTGYAYDKFAVCLRVNDRIYIELYVTNDTVPFVNLYRKFDLLQQSADLVQSTLLRDS